MENVNGALAFKASLDIDDFKVSSEAMGRYIKNASDTAVMEAQRMDSSLLSFAQNGAKYIVSYLVGQGMTSLVQSIVQVRGQFQQLEIAFNTMLGSTEKQQKLMSELVDTAARTPFDLSGIAQSTKQMLAYGASVDSVVDEIVMLGNVASGVGAPLQDIVYLYGTLRSQGRAYTVDIRQFAGRGIPIYEELGKVLNADRQELNKLIQEGKVGFSEVEQVFRNMTSQGGIYYNLMQEQSKSLTGMLSNLGDAWDSALNEIGKRNQDVFASAIQGAIGVVEHLDDIIRVVKAVAIAYGSYKAAVVLNTLATKGYTGVALIDNTVRQAKIALMSTEEKLTGRTAAQTRIMTEAQEAHVAALQKELTAEEQASLAKKLRIATIQQLLTEQQKEYLSNLNLTASSAEYEAAAMSVLTAEQREALSKTDLSSKSAVYRAALEQEVAAKMQSRTATLEAMRADVRAAAQKVESSKQYAISAMQATEAARYEVYWAKQGGDASRVAAAQKKLEAAQDTQNAARKAALSAQSELYAKRKQLEIAATRQSTAASVEDTAAKTTQATVTTALATATNKATLALKNLWRSIKSNPIGWILSLLGLVVSAISLFRKSEEEATDAMGEFQKTSREQIDNLELLFAILKNTESGTQTHRNAVEKINAVCKEYNKTLLDENATLDAQKLKYDELKTAIQQTTAEKIKAKYVEQEMQDYLDDSDANYKDFTKQVDRAVYDTGKKDWKTDQYGGYYETSVYNEAENIRNMSDAVKEAIRSQVEINAKSLAGMSGDAFTAEYDKVVSSILASTQAATKATDAEMASFKQTIEGYLDSQIDKTKEMNEAVKSVTDSLEKFFASDGNGDWEESTDYASLSFDELDKRIKNTQDEIDELNAKKVLVEADYESLETLKQTLDSLTGAKDAKTAGLNTESGINERIKQLREERSNVEINSVKYKELTDTINELEGRLPKSQGGSDKADEQLRAKQLEADRELEEARISVMEEGYDKRKAVLDLQHRENLERIDREERELAEARKNAGQGGLTAEEQQGFDERREIENTSYQKAQNTLFDGEIEYKKKQYALYFRWVRNLGADVANEQFSELLKGGASFKQYLENQISQMNQKRDSGMLTEGEANQLVTLNMQYDEITGAKSAMDAFKESVMASIAQASNLAEKVQAIADAKDRLASGGSGLVGDDEKAEASLFLSEKDVEMAQEIQEKILNNYRSYEEQKKDIQEEYALLRREAEAKGNKELLDALNEGENEALSALNAQMLMQSESWKNLFTDLDSLTVDQIDKLLREIQEKMSTADLDLNPADLKAVMDQLDAAKQKILDTNPFKAMGNALSAVFKKQQDGSKKTSEQIKTEWSDLADATSGTFDFINSAIDSCDVLGDALGDTGKATISMIQGVTMAGIAMASAIATAEKGSVILAAISIALQAIQWIATVFDKDAKIDEKIQNIQKEVDALSTSLDRLEHAADQTYWIFSDEERAAYEERVEAIRNEIAALEERKQAAFDEWVMTGNAMLLMQYWELTEQIEKMNDALEDTMLNGDIFELYESQIQGLSDQIKLIEEQMSLEKQKKDPDSDAIVEYENQIKDLEQQQKDMRREMLETLAGTDVESAIDDFADALVDAYCQGEDAAKALGEVTKSTLKNAVLEALKKQFLAKAINDAVLYLGEAMEDSVLSDEERRIFEQMVQDGADKFNAALEGLGDWIKDETESTDPLTGAVQSMSEETGGVIAGRLDAFIINQSDQLVIMRQCLIYQAEIAANTKLSASELTEIKETLRRIETKDNSLLSQGIS